jgi:hypothetical protein
MKHWIMPFLLTVFMVSVAGCSGSVEELPPNTEGGPSPASQDEIKKQMEESMKKGGMKAPPPAGEKK